MSSAATRRDLVLLVADKSIAQAITGLLQRIQALGVREIDYEIHVHQQRDPGCRLDAAAFLRPFASRFEHALVVFDCDGCGSDAFRSSGERVGLGVGLRASARLAEGERALAGGGREASGSEECNGSGDARSSSAQVRFDISAVGGDFAFPGL